MSLADDILHRVRGHGRGFVFSARDFVHIGSRAAIDQALTRMTRDGRIRRVDRGIYDLPRVHPRIGPLWPSAEVVAQAVARQTDSQVKATGAFAANALGLSTQVPAHAAYLTDGPTRSVQVGRLRVTLRHAGRTDMLLPDTTAGLVIVALRHLGRDAVSPELLNRLQGRLGDADLEQLRRVRRMLPGWLGAAVDQLLAAT